MTTCDLYCRVSTTEQATEGYSIGEQESRLRSFAEAQGWKVHACHIDPGFSGAKLERPGIQAVIRDAEEHLIQKVVTYKLDRLSRSQKDTLYLIEDVFLKNKVDYVSMTESLDTGTPFGMAMIGMLSVFAQLEREQIKERMSMGRLALVKDGHWRGGCGLPIGYRYVSKSGDQDGQIVVEPLEAAAVQKMFDLFLQGYNYRAILDRVYEEHPLPGRGKKNTSSWVPGILQNRIYIGEILYKGEYYKCDFEHIISDGVFWAAQKRLIEYQAEMDAHRRLPRKRGHLLTGFIYCGCCGSRANYHAVAQKIKSGWCRSAAYVCNAKSTRGKSCPDSKQWRAVDLEEVVLSQVESLRYEDVQNEVPEISPEVAAIEAKLAEIGKQQERLVQLFSIGSIPLDVIQTQSDTLLVTKKDLEQRLATLRSADTAATRERFLDAAARASGIRELDEDGQRDLLRVLIKRIDFYPDKTLKLTWNV